jgi:hypothetical protein
MSSTFCICCAGENGAWRFKITPVICTSVPEKWDLAIPLLAASALEAVHKQEDK